MSNQRLVPLNVLAAASAPAGQRAGDVYFNTSDDTLYSYNGAVWVASGGGAGGGGVTASATAPAAPEAGQGWFDTTTGNLYVYYDSFWVEVGANGGTQGPPGVIAATSPVTYDSGTQTVGINQTAITIAESQVTNLTSDLAAKAPLASPSLTGTPTAPTAAAGTSSTQIATTAFAATAASNAAAAVVASAPATLDTLNELASALGNDANFATTTATALGNRVRVDAAQSFTGTEKTQARSNIDAVSTSDSRLTDTRTPTDGSVSTAKVVDGAITNAKLANSSITVNGSAVSLGGSLTISGLPTQTGNAGKYLTTDGSAASWAVISGGSVVFQTSAPTANLVTGSLWVDSDGTAGMVNTNDYYSRTEVTTLLSDQVALAYFLRGA